MRHSPTGKGLILMGVPRLFPDLQSVYRRHEIICEPEIKSFAVVSGKSPGVLPGLLIEKSAAYCEGYVEKRRNIKKLLKPILFIIFTELEKGTFEGRFYAGSF